MTVRLPRESKVRIDGRNGDRVQATAGDSLPEGARVNLLTYTEPPVEADDGSNEGGSEPYYVPTDAASSDATNGEGVPYGNFGHDVSDESFGASSSEEVASTPLCAMCHRNIKLQCERCSMWVCELCGTEGGHESYGTRFRLWLSLGANLTEAGDRSVTASTESPDPAWSSRVSTYSYGGRPDW